jgi:signal peptide peptidase-like protein 2B
MGYGAGLLLTYVALMFSWFGDEGQPALLYLVPCTLGVVLLLAAARGELRALLTAGEDVGDDYQAYNNEYEAVGSARAGAGLIDDDATDGFAAADGASGVGNATGGIEDALVAIDGQQAAGGVSKPVGFAGAAASDVSGAVGSSRGRGGSRVAGANGRQQG